MERGSKLSGTRYKTITFKNYSSNTFHMNITFHIKAANFSFNLDEKFEDKKSEAANFITYVYANAIV